MSLLAFRRDPGVSGLPVVSQERAHLHQQQLQRINRIDPRDWLKEAGERLRGERTTLPTDDHLWALWQWGDSFRLAADERGAVITELLESAATDARRIARLQAQVAAFLQAAGELQERGRTVR